MNLHTFALCMLTVACAFGCDPQGVSLGTEELCVADAELLVAQERSTEHVSTCAEIGENQLANASFETPLVDCADDFCQFPAADVEGWQTTGTTIEFWQDGKLAVPAPDGGQFAELNAQSQDTLSQEVASRPGQLMYWSFLHRGRNGLESVELLIGPREATVSQGFFASPADAWSAYSGLYRVGDAQFSTRFELASRTRVFEGNLIDAVVFAPVD